MYEIRINYHKTNKDWYKIPIHLLNVFIDTYIFLDLALFTAIVNRVSIEINDNCHNNASPD